MNEVATQAEIAQLRAQITALEELLEVYEQETLEKSQRLEQTLQELLHSEDALRVLQSILESMGDAVVVVDAHGGLLFSNAAADRFSGTIVDWLQSPGDTPLPFHDGQTAAPLTVATFPLKQAMSGQAIVSMELFIPMAAMLPEWFSVTAQPLIDAEGTAQGAVAVFHNITSSKHAEHALRISEAQSRQQAQQLHKAFVELRHTQAQLVQTEKMSSLGQLVAGIAHEINNPINFIYGNISPAQDYLTDLLEVLELYQEHYPNPLPTIQRRVKELDLPFILEDFPKLLRSLQMGTDRIRQIVASLRNFSRLDEAEMKPVNLHDGIDNTLLILQSRLKSKQNLREVQVIRHYGTLPLVECYAGQLNQVFMNILSNAIDALHGLRLCPEADEAIALDPQHRHPPCQPQPTIWIQTQLSAGDRVEIRIRNNGPSIDPSIINRLFDPFFTTKPVGKGTGLGLYISYQIVTERHGGTIACLSDPELGVEFAIAIPLSQHECAATPPYDPDDLEYRPD